MMFLDDGSERYCIHIDSVDRNYGEELIILRNDQGQGYDF